MLVVENVSFQTFSLRKQFKVSTYSHRCSVCTNQQLVKTSKLDQMSSGMPSGLEILGFKWLISHFSHLLLHWAIFSQEPSGCQGGFHVPFMVEVKFGVLA